MTDRPKCVFCGEEEAELAGRVAELEVELARTQEALKEIARVATETGIAGIADEALRPKGPGFTVSRETAEGVTSIPLTPEQVENVRWLMGSSPARSPEGTE